MNDLFFHALRIARESSTRLGHDLVWLLIALLFCVVEAVVLITELRPSRLFRARVRPVYDPTPELESDIVVPSA